MAHVALPERPRTLGLPAQAGLAPAAVAHRHPVETVVGEEAAHRRLGDLACRQAPVGDQGAEDDRHRRRGVLAADVEEQLALGVGQLEGVPLVPRIGAQPVEPAPLVGVVPALQRRHGVGARRGAARRPQPLLAQGQQLLGQLAAQELAVGESADDLGAEERDFLGVVLGREGIHRGSFPRRRVGRLRRQVFYISDVSGARSRG